MKLEEAYNLVKALTEERNGREYELNLYSRNRESQVQILYKQIIKTLSR